MINKHLAAFILLFTAILAGCAVNPVTGRSELRILSESQEIALGQDNYLPLRQMEGGDYTVDAGLTAYVNEVGQRLAAVSHRPRLPYEFVVVNNSVPNAWALPGGKIALNRGLLVELGSEAEMAAVIGHEIVHAAARHSAQRIERQLVMQMGVAAVGASTDSDGVVLAATIGAVMLGQRYSREAEFEADRFGMLYMQRAGYDPMAAVDLQETFLRLSEGSRGGWLEGLFASHPPSRARVEANRLHAEELGAGGELGRDRYQARIAHLVATREAYEAHDEGRQALAKGDTSAALQAAERAIAKEPREALFHGLRADAYRIALEHRAAIQHYQAALQRHEGFFAFHLGNGFSKRALGDTAGARAHFVRSNELLPTEIGVNALKELDP